MTKKSSQFQKMALIVQKYGGTSVGSAERIKKVAERIKKWSDAGHKVVTVVSAMSGETNRLVDISTSLNHAPPKREMDVILSAGEQISMGLLCLALQELGQPAVSYTGWQAGIHTDSAHTKARITGIEPHRIFKSLDDGRVVVVAGFQGIDDFENITTLGRGGSDTSAVAIAAALNADECQIYTDVDGVYTTDPRVETNARPMEVITFEEMLEMASLGSKVLQIRSVEFAFKNNIPIRVLSSMNEEVKLDNLGGTLIRADIGEDNIMEQPLISGIAFNRDEAKITILGVPDKPGIAYDILGKIASENIEVDMIVQNISPDNKLTDFTFTVTKQDFKDAMRITKRKAQELGANDVIGDDNIAKLSIVGVGMRSHAGVASSMFGALAEEGINILSISTSEIKISVIIEQSQLDHAVRCLHKAFELDK